MTDAKQADLAYMQQALELAARGAMTTHPNPMVGCVLVAANKVIGRGWHYRAGEAHAEINAIEDAHAHGHSVAGATAYVTLEPCAHQGRTGACCIALAHAKIACVVVAMRDPNPLVQGRGVEYLKQQGVEVREGIRKEQAQALNRTFIKRMTTGLPWVSVKMAASLDGATAMDNGQSQWISCAAAREDVQRLRATAGCVLTGSGTFYADNPSLNVRPQSWKYGSYSHSLLDKATQPHYIRQPKRAIISSKAPRSAAARSKIFHDGIETYWLSPQVKDYSNYPQHIVPINIALNAGYPDLEQVLRSLAQYEINSVLVEAGARLAGAFINSGLVDELVLYYAPVLMGANTRRMFELPFQNMSERLALEIKSVRHVGETVRICAQVKKASQNK